MAKLVSGQVVARVYQIETELGEGTMARAYRAFHFPTEQVRVLKILRARFSRDTSIVQQFMREGTLLSALDHPHIVRIIEQGYIDRCPYLAFEYVPGPTLRQLLQKQKHKRLRARYAVELAAQAAEALRYAQAKIGLTHMDIKPENLLVDPTWQLKVLDFGFADYAFPHYGIDTVSSGHIHGTLGYVAPEQLAGQAGIDGRADIYSLGVCLFEMLTGILPFEAHTMEDMIELHRIASPRPLHYVLIQPHPQLEAVLLRAIAVDPEKRWRSIDDFASALRALQKDPKEATPHSHR